MKVEQRPSPNFSDRHETPTVLVIHADASPNEDGTLDWLSRTASKVSYHALIGRTGRVYAIVPVSKKAWHCGISEFEGRSNVNAFSVGLSFANRNDGIEAYTDAQYEAGALWTASLMKAYPRIEYARFTTHAAIARPVGRKVDPGPQFSMSHFIDCVRRVAA